jgi:dephospho-CoA kinase
MSFVLGLTGSIGMGKSTTAAMFAEEGAAVWDADAAVHRLYAAGGAAVPAVAAAFPGAITEGAVSRERLKSALAADPAALPVLERIVHPLVAADRAAFLAATTAPVAVIDVPLLFETGTDALCDATAVVSTSPDLQRARVLARPGMSGPQLDAILARQMPDAEKRARATWVIDTTTLDGARAAVRRIMDRIRERQSNA